MIIDIDRDYDKYIPWAINYSPDFLWAKCVNIISGTSTNNTSVSYFVTWEADSSTGNIMPDDTEEKIK